MLQPLFFPIWGGVIFLLAIASYVFPKEEERGTEYTRFFLSSIGSFWVLYMFGRLVADYRWEELFISERWLLVLLFVWITLTHIVYPFKKTKRNRLFTVLSLVLLIIMFILTAVAWIGME